MTYFVKQGTSGKLITRGRPNEPATVINWKLRHDFYFDACLIDHSVIKSKIENGESGVALFAGKNGGERDSMFVLAVSYSDVKILSPVDPIP